MILEQMSDVVVAWFMQIVGTCLARTRYYIDIKTNRQPVTLHNAIGVMRIVGVSHIAVIFSQGRCRMI